MPPDWYSQPVYGLVFLFKWKEDDPVKQEPSCPPGVWFANQVRRLLLDCVLSCILLTPVDYR